MKLFTPDDFKDIYKKVFAEGYKSHGAGDMWEPLYRSDDISEVANAKLAKLIESAPVVWFNDDKTMSPYWEASSRQNKKHTHKARLMFIEPIVKEPCKHKNILYHSHHQASCTDCSIQFVAKWEPKNET